MDLSEQFNSSVNQAFSVIESNKVLSTVLGLFLVLYAALAAPILPMSVTKIFKNTWFKLAFMFLIAYTATKDPSVAIISAVALLVTLQTLAAQETTNAVVRAVEKKVEAFGDVEPAISTDNYNEVSDYAAPYQNYEILPKEVVVPSESDRQKQIESTQFVLQDQVNMNTYVAQPTEVQMPSQIPTEMPSQMEINSGMTSQMNTDMLSQMEMNSGMTSQMNIDMSSQMETQMGSDMNTENTDNSSSNSFNILSNLTNLVTDFETFENSVQPFGGEINYELRSINNNGMESFANEDEEKSQTKLITGTCGSAMDTTEVPGFEDGEFATFN